MSGQNENNLDDLLLDRLVDGELSDTEYRETLGSVESHPDGWRRCALAFLEAQAWGREFRLVRTETPAVAVAVAPARRSGSWLYFGAMAIACAASFLLAFGVANQLQSRSRNLPSAANLAVHPSPTPDANSVADPSHQFASDSNSSNQPTASRTDGSPMGHYRLVVNGETGPAQEVEMPVFAADDPRADMLLDEYATMPHEIIRALQNSGNEVQHRRNWIPMRTTAGAPMYVPVDELQVTPVSNRSYQ